MQEKSASINYSIDTDGDLNGRAVGCKFFFPDTSCLMAGLAEALGGATLVTHEHDWWFLSEEEVDRLLIHVRAVESDSND